LGGGFFIFRLYFAVFALLVSMVILRLRSGGGFSTVLAPALFVLGNPLTLHSTLLGIQDDIIVTLLFGIAIWAMLHKRMRWGAIGVGIGMACKMWPVLLVPSLLTGHAPWIKKIGRALGALAILVGSLLPFYLLTPDNVTQFLRLYVTGDSGEALQGVSLWRYAGQFGLDPFVVLPALFVCGALLLYLAMRWHTPPLTTSVLFVLLFLLLYPKIHSGFYLPLVLYFALFWNNRQLVWAGLAISLGAVGLDTCNWLGWDSGAMTTVPLMLAGSLWLLIATMLIQTVQDHITSQQGTGHKTLALTETSRQTAQGPQQGKL
jgi:hypothetical protein